jgi:hypothetical protein
VSGLFAARWILLAALLALAAALAWAALTERE